tara:strand:+ start:72 stop:1085 length:1014 start_codon:yes stop_codon:yes gene_type:complete
MSTANNDASTGSVNVTQARARLRQVQEDHDRIAAFYNAMPLPTAAALCLELRTNQWLGSVVHSAATDLHTGFGCYVAKVDANYEEFTYEELVEIVPFVRRLGYSVCIFISDDVLALKRCPFAVYFPGHPTPRSGTPSFWAHANEGCGYVVALCGTAPDQLGWRGLITAVVRFKVLLERARVRLADPRRPGAQAALAAELATELAASDPPHWAGKRAVVQDARKRKLVEALHADGEDVDRGARWANIHVNGERASGYHRWIVPNAFVNMMRAEAVAGDHFVFQQKKVSAHFETSYDVVVLHRDAFEVADAHPEATYLKGEERDFKWRWKHAQPPSEAE